MKPTDREREVFRAVDAANRATARRESARALAIVGFGFVGVVVCLIIALLCAKFL